MTNDEAEALLAEIKEKMKFYGSIETGHCNYVELSDIEKIIKSFADQPDEMRSFQNSEAEVFTISHDKKDKVACVGFNLSVTLAESAWYSLDEFKEIVEYCNEVLKYLESKD